MPRTSLIEAKLVAILDDAEFLRRPLEQFLIQFTLFRQYSKIVKSTRYLSVEVIFTYRKHDPAYESRKLFIAARNLQ
jgi:hypothetical protein